MTDAPALKTLCFTGHRPAPGHYSLSHPYRIEVRRRLTLELMQAISKGGYNTFISGMALGFDIDAALCVLSLREDHQIPGIYLTAAIPFVNWDAQWNSEDVATYKQILAAANNVVTVSPPGFAKWKYMERNKFMVNASEHVIAFWNGTPGGTANTVAYAVQKDVPVQNLLAVDVNTAPAVVKAASNKKHFQRNYKKAVSGNTDQEA